jgi:hypothetical protein
MKKWRSTGSGMRVRQDLQVSTIQVVSGRAVTNFGLFTGKQRSRDEPYGATAQPKADPPLAEMGLCLEAVCKR